MNRGLLALATSAVLALAIPAAASAGQYTLHPNGFGQHTYAAWNAQEGLPDSHGTADQALYLQKGVATDVFAAAAARIHGFEGEQASSLTAGDAELAFWVREDSYCNLGAPRFNVYTQEAPFTQFIGCAAMEDSGTATDSEGREWVRKSYDGPLTGTVTAIAIILDEGPNQAWLDNIQVRDQCWTSPADNGQNPGADACAAEE